MRPPLPISGTAERALKLGVWLGDLLAMHFTRITSRTHRTYTPLFHISVASGRCVLKLGVFLDTHYMRFT